MNRWYTDVALWAGVWAAVGLVMRWALAVRRRQRQLINRGHR